MMTLGQALAKASREFDLIATLNQARLRAALLKDGVSAADVEDVLGLDAEQMAGARQEVLATVRTMFGAIRLVHSREEG